MTDSNADLGDSEIEFARLLDEYQQALELGEVSNFWTNRNCVEADRDRVVQIGSTVADVELYFAGNQTLSFDAELEFGGRLFPRFAIERELGRGSNGIVYLALDTTLNRHVAIKIPRTSSQTSPSVQKRFRQEAELAASIDHPHILPILEIGSRSDTKNGIATNSVDQGQIDYIVSAYCPGPNLSNWLKSTNQGLTINQSVELVLRLAEGLDACHAQNILHRDIKPANIMLFPVECGRLPFWPKLTDFGLAKSLESDVELTASNEWVGTPRYMAAEQIIGSGSDIGTATDVYALGAVLYELIVGRPPFDATDLPVLFDQIRSSQPQSPRSLKPQIPGDLASICMKCLQKSASQRYANARELAAELRRFLDGKPILASSAELKLESVRQTAVTIAIAGSLLLVVGILIWSWINRSNDRINDYRDTFASTSMETDGFSFSSERNTVFVAPLTYVGSKPLTIETWIRPSYPRGMILNFGGFLSLFSDDGRPWVGPAINLILPNKPMMFLHAETTLPPNEWAHLACVYDGQSIAMYINGSQASVQVFSEDASGIRGSVRLSELEPIRFDFPNNDQKLSIGGNYPGTQEQYRYPFSGSIREVRISSIARYTNAFVPTQQLPIDAYTVSIYRFDSATNTIVYDQANHSAPAMAETHLTRLPQ